MNIFRLDNCPAKAAELMCDKHVVKMIVEYAQILSTAHRVLDGTPTKQPSKSGKTMQTHYALDSFDFEQVMYKASHVNHPSSVWARESVANYQWLYRHFRATCNEYFKRYGKIHATAAKLAGHLAFCPSNIPQGQQTPLPQCMPDHYKCDDVTTAYQNYYRGDKAYMAVWKNTPTPSFMLAA